MITKPATITNVDEYITSFPKNAQKHLKQVRAIVIKAAPGAEEMLSYKMPYYKYHGRLLYFAAHTNHLGLYPMAAGIERFKKELAGYKTAKGSVQFPFDKPLPAALITKIIKFRVNANLEKEELKKKR